MYRAGEISIYQAYCKWAIQPYSLGGGGMNCPGEDQQVTTDSLRIVPIVYSLDVD